MAAGDAARARAAREAEEAEYDEWLAAAEDRSADVKSMVLALHTELDKLTKKWPTMPVSDLMLQRVNKAIRETHALMGREENDLLSDINEFVAAGDNPESRDALLVLAELSSLLERFRMSHFRDWH